MNKRQFLLLQLTMMTLCVYGIEILFFKSYIIYLAILNPLVVIGLVAVMRKETTPKTQQHTAPNDTMEKLVHHINHDINTPLTKIIGFCESAIIEDTSCEHQQTLEKVLDNAMHLKTINAKYVKLMNIKMASDQNFTPIDLSEEVRRVMIEFIKTLDENQVKYAVQIPEKPVFVLGNQRLLREALRNIIDHATVKHLDETHVHIELKTHGQQCHIMIENYGFAAEVESDRIAQKVFTLHHESSYGSLGHAGLSMAITKAIFEHHKGLIDYYSNGTQGMKYQITLPTYHQVK